jgi:hypothetical protein
MEITGEMLEDLTLEQAELLFGNDIYSVERDSDNQLQIHSKCCYYYSEGADKPYKRVDYRDLFLFPKFLQKDESINWNYYDEQTSNVKQYISDFEDEYEFLSDIKQNLVGLSTLLITKVNDNTSVGKYISINEEIALKIFKNKENDRDL